jgi:hypothetical protein
MNGPVSIAVVVLVALAGGAAYYVVRKGRHLAGEHVFRASRLSAGNHLFPSQVVVTPASITLYTPRWIGRVEESLHMAHVASITITTHAFFADISIETTSGQEPVRCHGHLKRDAVEMKNVIERYQGEYYRTGARDSSAAKT